MVRLNIVFCFFAHELHNDLWMIHCKIALDLRYCTFDLFQAGVLKALKQLNTFYNRHVGIDCKRLYILDQPRKPGIQLVTVE